MHASSRWKTLVLLPAALLLLPVSSVYADEAPLILTETRQVSTDGWQPLTETQINQAVADAALTVLTQEAHLRIVTGDDSSAQGNLGFHTSLIGPARTAKTTLVLDSARTGSLVSTASVSLDGMDHQGIFNAFEHVGAEAARRMAAHLRVLAENRAPAKRQEGNSILQQRFEKASALKREGRFGEARKLFLDIMQQPGDNVGNWPELAADEVRYGLPMFHAQHLLSGGGRFQVAPDAVLSNLDEAENLLRQVHAENAGVAERVQESQRLLDRIAITRNALRRSMQANSLARMAPLRMMITEQVMMSGECPAREQLAEMIDYLPDGIGVDGIEGEADMRIYRVSDASSGLVARLSCNASRHSNPVELSVE